MSVCNVTTSVFFGFDYHTRRVSEEAKGQYQRMHPKIIKNRNKMQKLISQIQFCFYVRFVYFAFKRVKEYGLAALLLFIGYMYVFCVKESTAKSLANKSSRQTLCVWKFFIMFLFILYAKDGDDAADATATVLARRTR